MNICIFGDSITWGACDYKNGGWANMFRNSFASDDTKVYNCGVAGDDTDDLLEHFQIEAQARGADVVIFAIGINDSQYTDNRDNPRVPQDQFVTNLECLISQAQKVADKILFVGLTAVDESKVTPIPWSDKNKNYDNTNVDLYNSLIENVCDKNHLPFLNVLNVLTAADLADGLHPNTAGHEKMFNVIKKFVTNNIQL